MGFFFLVLRLALVLFVLGVEVIAFVRLIVLKICRGD